MIKAKVLGRETLTKKLNDIAPKANQYAAEAKLQIANEAAEAISDRAPIGTGTSAGDYAASIQGARISDRPNAKAMVGTSASKDPDATGIFASWIWHFLEFGTRPHNTAKGGGTALGKKQTEGARMHPGTKAQPHIFPIWRSFRERAKKRINDAVWRGVREAMKK
ncbi:HK97 gp10 family phage protein [Agrobacterium sp. lyk4-40-TYG-31]|uniref:HK97 gp10 family phage protein n=1 Tax=Agrobacterium sp. lyk4-40-TYG-31 TaxID=3040276 RepID=UPI002550AC29|nr:HK97 gp10 family phage protein [Agrobacterium sp. lyk4-40-TYG-31]